MTPSLRTLLTGLIDYAGLFPPAKLPLEEAIANYGRYRRQPDAWMLGRFVCPAAKLNTLGSFHNDLFEADSPFAFSVLAPSEPSWAETRPLLEDALRQIQEFRQRHAGRVTADVLELKAPTDMVDEGDPKATARGLRHIAATIEQAGLRDLRVFFEFGVESGDAAVGTVCEAIALANRGAAVRAGFKLRCGGVRPEAFPTAEQIALVIRTAAINQVPLKATAGLHHPFPPFDASIGVKVHGFINVFSASILAYTRHLEPGMLIDLLKDEEPSRFMFDEDGLHYGAFHATTAEIAEARREAVTSFGSCSFDEPCNDLRTLGWL
jgi:hypothetical protein